MLNVNQGVNFILLPCYTKLMLILMAFSNPIPEWQKAAKLSSTESRKYLFPWHAATAFFSHSSPKVTLSQRTVFSNQSPLRLYFVKLCCWLCLCLCSLETLLRFGMWNGSWKNAGEWSGTGGLYVCKEKVDIFKWFIWGKSESGDN